MNRLIKIILLICTSVTLDLAIPKLRTLHIQYTQLNILHRLYIEFQKVMIQKKLKWKMSINVL